ncbi:hypothetical protein [Alloalcanivorax xenomutans]|uniref:Uncharacterized protein n=1 Tax=Alloalcanivorax xenomutans TaxID=1094342 RepID=A0A9Q3ZE46_9GAMM|nr:hypothetical protein [Alloalcanivorax xenomutans]MCE7510255.1 hypothetical protein [Alloalcanivorax xenomutans]
MKKMKLTERIALISIVIGAAAGFGLTFILEGAHWAVYVVFGVLIAAGANAGLTQAEKDKKELD